MDVTFSPDGKLLAAASGDDTRPTRPGHVRIYRADSGERVRDLDKHVRVATGVAFSPDGTMLASTGQDETVHVYSVETGELLRIYEGHSRGKVKKCGLVELLGRRTGDTVCGIRESGSALI